MLQRLSFENQRPAVQPATTAGRPTWILSLIGIYFVAALAYVFYATETQTGVFGYLIALQMRTIGFADINATAVLGAVLIAGVPVILMLALLQKFSPAAFRSVASAATRQPVARGLQFAWKRIFGITGFLLAATVVIGSLSFLVVRGQDQTVYHLDLTSPESNQQPNALPKHAVFVELNALLVRGYLVGYREDRNASSDLNVYAPLSGPGWRPGEPVRYFVHHVTYGSSTTTRPDLPSAFRQRGPAQFTGKLGGSLPVVVEQDFRAKGLTLAPGYIVIDWTDTPGNMSPVSDKYMAPILIGLIGAMLTIITFFVLAFDKLLARRGRLASASDGIK